MIEVVEVEVKMKVDLRWRDGEVQTPPKPGQLTHTV
jgi:hypothetical protein